MKALFLTLALCAGWTTGGLISSESVTIPPTTCPNHGNPTLCCRSTKWTDLVVFYLGNYVAHALTTKITPGQNPFSAIVAIFAALLFPTSGIARSLRAISSGAIFAKTELQVAARAGALLMIVKAEYAYDDSSPHDRADVSTAKFHGRCILPNGFILVKVPTNAVFESNGDKYPLHVSSNYNATKALIALGQLLFAINTLYETRGDQITRYGYAAFGLTVAPYAWMSFINLLGNLVCPDYPTMYLVENSVSQMLRKQLETRSGEHGFPIRHNDALIQLDGFVGILANEKDVMARLTTSYEWIIPTPLFPNFLGETLEIDTLEWFFYISTFVGCLFPLIIYGILSRFRPMGSTYTQRVWTMTWLVFGFFIGPAIEGSYFYLRIPALDRLSLVSVGYIVVFMAPAIGGFVVVGQMINAYGICAKVT